MGKKISLKYDYAHIGEEYRALVKAENKKKFKVMAKSDEDLEIEKMLQ